MSIRISATTVMLPDYDMEETAQLLSRLGFDGAEWRCRHIPESARDQPYSPWGNVKNDLSPDNLMQRGEEVVALSREYGLEIACLATAMRADELDEVRKVAEGCSHWGIRRFRIGAPRGYNPQENYRDLLDDTIRALEPALAIARECGVRALLEIHRNTVACSASQAYLIVRNFDPQDIGVIFDIANMSLGQGHEPTKMGLDLLGPYVQHVHAGGGAPVAGERGPDGQQLWNWETVDLADSVIDVPQFVRELAAMNYQGFISVEDFRPLPTEEKLLTQLQFLRSVDPS
ncbi:MAG: sugar phosphate isomerase/epimerase [Armatimonadetes bacterium]|nr:sugar phosphate isomerase/epimerase [Armatimonadota bacterium]